MNQSRAGRRVSISLSLAGFALLFSGCQKQHSSQTEKTDVKKPANLSEYLEFAKKKILSSDSYEEIPCKSSFTSIDEDAQKLCFGGYGDAEEFIKFFTLDVAKQGSGEAYWNRNFGLWSTNFYLTHVSPKDAANGMAVIVKMKGDAPSIRDDPKFKYDMVIYCAIPKE